MSKYSLSLPRNKELFDSIAPQITEICTVSKSLPLFLKYSVKCLFLKRLYQTVENLKYTSAGFFAFTTSIAFSFGFSSCFF